MHVAGLDSPAEEFDAYISSDGLEIYFESQRSGNGDIYRATRPSVGAGFSAPELVTEISTALQEGSPARTADRRTLVMNRTDGTETDLCIATREDPSGTFSAPQVLENVNVPLSYEIGAWLSPAGDILCFSSTRTGTDDLYFATRSCP